MVRSLAALSLLLMSTTALAQGQRPARGGGEANAWDVNAPPGQRLRQVPINTNEGTWMNLDVSPDGRTIAVDMLGDIYTMPIGGGTPTRISSGLAYDQQPRSSPHGGRIAFTSDRGGGDNIWVMGTDGTGARAVTSETFTLLNNPTWSPDGRFIAARKHFTTQRSLGTGEIWLYAVNGTGGGVALVERSSPQLQKELGEPVFSHDGASIYFTRDASPGNTFQYVAGFQHRRFVIERYEMATGERTQSPAARAARSARSRRRRAPIGLRPSYRRAEPVCRPRHPIRRASGRSCRSRPGSAGNLGGARRLSEHGWTPAAADRLLGRRPHPPVNADGSGAT